MGIFSSPHLKRAYPYSKISIIFNSILNLNSSMMGKSTSFHHRDNHHRRMMAKTVFDHGKFCIQLKELNFKTRNQHAMHIDQL